MTARSSRRPRLTTLARLASVASLSAALFGLAPIAQAGTVSYQDFLGLSFLPGTQSGVLAPGESATLSDGYAFDFDGGVLSMRTLFDRSAFSLAYGYGFRLSDDLAFEFAGSPFVARCVEPGASLVCAREGEGAFLAFRSFPTLVGTPVTIRLSAVGTVDAPSTLACMALALPIALGLGRRRRRVRAV